MVEMLVRTVDHHAGSGAPVVLLLPREREDGSPVTVTVDASAACSLRHELDGISTPRTRAYSLLVQAVRAVGGYIAAIMLSPGPTGEPAAQVRIGLRHRWDDQPVEMSAALGLSVHLSLPVLVADTLAQVMQTPGPHESQADPRYTADASLESSTVPAPFLRALGD